MSVGREDLERLLGENAGAAFALALAVTADADDAGDAVQEAFLRAARDFSRWRPERPFRAWLLRIVHDAAVSLVRERSARRRREGSVPMPAETLSPPQAAERLELHSALQGALMALDERARLPLMLHYQQGLSHAEVAEVLGQPPGTVAASISRGLERLRESLARSGYAATGGVLFAALTSAPQPVVPVALVASIKGIVAQTALAGKAGVVAASAVKGGLAVKIVAGVVLAGALAGTIGLMGPIGPMKPAAPPPAADLNNLPEVVPDESAKDWVVDRFAGNSTTGGVFYQGPAREVGGLGSPGVTTLPDGTIYVGGAVFGADGVLRLFMGGDGPLEGPLEQCSAGGPIWNAKEKALYLTGPRCLRKVVEKPDGTKWIEVVAGIPDKEPPPNTAPQNGPAKTATFPLDFRGWVCNSKGVFYRLDIWHGIRKLENGTVSNVPLKFMDEPKNFALHLGGNLSRGEDDETLYVADHWNFVARRIDLKTGEVRNVALMPNFVKRETQPSVQWARCGRNNDGPALTHASSNSGCAYAVYDPFHKALWLGGPDESRFRWLKDGWVKTVIGTANGQCVASGSWPCNSLGTPAEKANIVWSAVCGLDDKGGVYIAGASLPHGVWRAYNKKEGASHETWLKGGVKP